MEGVSKQVHPFYMHQNKLTLKLLSEEDRPREKLLLKGKHTLSDAELLAILLRSGARNKTAVELSQELLTHYDNDLHTLARQHIKELCRFKGLGSAKALSIIAALEIGGRKRMAAVKKIEKISSSRDAYEYLAPILTDLQHEEFWILLLNRNNKLLRMERISQGGVTGTVVDTKLVFRSALLELASSLIVAHNHPSGNLRPSDNDIHLTKQLVQAGKLFDIPVCDHLIIGNTAYYSFADEGILGS
jgi:DNA repair protein RadC